MSFDEPSLQAAMRAYLDACAALDAASDDAQVLALSDQKSVTAMQLKNRLVEQGWTAPVRQRSTT